MAIGRPENIPPEIFYNETEANKYTRNSRIIEVQLNMCERAIELLHLPEEQPSLLLDLGCGSGLSGNVIEELGHQWIGYDISQPMLSIAKERDVKGDLLLGDFGDGLPFRAGMFDGAVSISALQWLCYSYSNSQNPKQRIKRFFVSLYSVLSRSARAVFQFYPENSEQSDLLTRLATEAGFMGGLVIDYPNSTKAKKTFLVLTTNADGIEKSLAIEGDPDSVKFTKIRENLKDKKSVKYSKNWILQKKERRRLQGKETRKDSKYTGRRRSGKF